MNSVLSGGRKRRHRSLTSYLITATVGFLATAVSWSAFSSRGLDELLRGNAAAGSAADDAGFAGNFKLAAGPTGL